MCGAELLRFKEAEITAADVGQQVACMLLDEIQRCDPLRHPCALAGKPRKSARTEVNPQG